jgi:L,D-transpeptidase catalytic domain
LTRTEITLENIMRLCSRLASAFAIILAIAFSSAGAWAQKVEIIISKVSQKMTVKVDGDTEYVWPVSTGAARYETPSGTFRPFRMEKDHFSKEWDDAPMPHSIFFTERGHAIHGSFYTKSLGRRASHGCVRLAPENAAKLFALVGEAGMSNTRVTLKGGFFDFSGGGAGRSFAQVGDDIDRVVKNKQQRGLFWNFGKPKKKQDVKAAKKKDVKPKKVAAAKKPDDKAKKVAAVAPKKPDDKVKKVTDKCVTKDGKKVCGKTPAVKAASNG